MTIPSINILNIFITSPVSLVFAHCDLLLVITDLSPLKCHINITVQDASFLQPHTLEIYPYCGSYERSFLLLKAE